METIEAIKQLTKALKEDETYYTTWKDNISISIQDEFLLGSDKNDEKFYNAAKRIIQERADKAADRFLQLLIKQ